MLCKIFFAKLAVGWILLIVSVSVFAEDPLRFGVLIVRPKEQISAEWQSLATYLETVMGRQIELKLYGYPELDVAVTRKEVDVVLTNPGHYILLRHRDKLSAPLVTQTSVDDKHKLANFGGVIFTLNVNTQINSLGDLTGKRIAAVTINSLGGYQMQAFELFEAGIPLPDQKNLLFTGMPHDLVVNAVLDGRADVGFVRSGILETMVREGKLDIARIKVIHNESVLDFPYMISTSLYPEWPVAVMPLLDEEIAKRLAIALLSLPSDSDVARSLKTHGFTIPSDYSRVEDVLRQLRMPPFDYAPTFTIADLWDKYEGWISFLGVLGLLLTGTTASLVRQNHRIHQMMHYNRSLIEASLDPLVTINKEGKIMDLNNATIFATGWSREALQDSDFSDYFVNPQAARAGYQKVFNDGSISDYPLTIRHRDGHFTDVLYNATVYRNATGQIEGVFATARDITKQKRYEEALRDHGERLSLATIHNGVGIWDWNLITQELIWDDSMYELYHRCRDNFSGTGDAWRESVHPEDLDRGNREVEAAVSGEKTFDTEFRVCWPTGEVRHIKAAAKVFFDEQGIATRMLGINVDITEHKKTEVELRIAATAFESQEGIMITDAKNNILRVNTAFTCITGYTAAELIGKNPRILQSKQHDKNFYAAMWESINRTGAWQGEIWNQRKSGEIYPEQLGITAVKDQHGIISNYVATLSDITLRKEAVEKIESLAFYDPLTGLPNRRLLQDRLKPALAASHRNGHQGALLFIDMDNFKTLNDTLGHDMGDLLLQHVAQRLESCVREGDTVARLGGDEFVIMLEDLSDKTLEAATQTKAIGNKILTALNQNYLLAGHDYHSTSSIGATLFIGQKKSLEELLKQADIAMYHAKALGRNTLCFFDPQMQITINTRAALEDDLRQALASNQLVLYYQPQVNHNRQIIGAEVLIRWQHPLRGLVSPTDFIPLAEETLLILPIGQWVLNRACAQIKIWEASAYTQNFQLAVNVSSRQFYQPDFVAQVSQIINQHAINPNRLKLELTESLVLDNIDDTICKLNVLRNIGVRFSMDDFGTGYSSLSSLKKLPLDQLKIDQSFVSDISTDPDDTVILETIITMAKKLHMEIIAEGVETEAQYAFLEQSECQLFQGYLFSKPVPIEQFEALLGKVLVTHNLNLN